MILLKSKLSIFFKFFIEKEIAFVISGSDLFEVIEKYILSIKTILIIVDKNDSSSMDK